MNKKQCPKCGEENPPEAVMCWACYTPLSGTPIGGASAAGAGAAATTYEDGEKKKIPPWQMGVIGVGLLLAVGIGVRSMMPSSSSTDAGLDTPPATHDPATAPATAPGATAPAPSPPSPSPSGGSSVTPTEAPYKIVVPPNPRLSTATMAIVPTDSNASGPQAASYAAYVRRQYAGKANWNTIYIYVFSDEKSAQAFADFMKQRRGAALGDSDYSSLSNLWGTALARYEYSTQSGKGVERVLYPSKNPSGWWYGRT